jgi:acetyl-CoA synthetase
MSHHISKQGSGSERRVPILIPDSASEYAELISRTNGKRDEFWRSCAEQLDWTVPYSTIAREDFTSASVSWFSGGELNACSNALDHQIETGNGDHAAVVTIDEKGVPRKLTYNDLYRLTLSIAGGLAKHGLKTGDRAALYLPDCPESVAFMLACARMGVIIVPIPVRFTAEAISEIINDCEPSLLVVSLGTDPESYGDRARSVMAKLNDIQIINIGRESGGSVQSLSEFSVAGADNIPPVSVPAEQPLLIIYANSAAGVPRGSVFATGGFLVQSFASFDALFSYRPETTAQSIVSTIDLASAAGQSYGLWGPLLLGRTLLLAGNGTSVTPEYLSAVAKAVETPALLTSPRTIAALRDSMGVSTLLSDARFTVIACTGDVLVPRLIKFAGAALTKGPERVLNLWIQSETGTALIATYPSTGLNQPGSLGVPFPGIEPLALNNFGEPCRPNESGQLVFVSSWPSMIRTIWGQADRYREFYFMRERGNFSTNDGVRIDAGGFYWFMGRLDDVIKVRGQSLATSEIETVLVSHPEVTEAAVISAGIDEPDSLYAFLVLASGRADEEADGSLENELKILIARRIGEFATPTRFIFSSELPRTRTGKIVRRVLRRVVSGDISSDEDLSHVANPQAVEELIRKKGS